MYNKSFCIYGKMVNNYNGVYNPLIANREIFKGVIFNV